MSQWRARRVWLWVESVDEKRVREPFNKAEAIASKIRMASERDGWPGTPMRHSSMSFTNSAGVEG